MTEPDEIWKYFEESWKDAMEPKVRIRFEFDGRAGHEVPADASEDEALEKIRRNIDWRKSEWFPPEKVKERWKGLEGKEFEI